jgi:hypothetical protein
VYDSGNVHLEFQRHYRRIRNSASFTYICAVELHLSGLIGTASLPDKQKNWITEFFFENRLHWQFEVGLLLFKIYICGHI